MAHPKHCSLGAVHHLYTLHRGDTTAKVQDVCFTNDSRWIAVTTLHGTTHIFPITPYGGSVSVRTHTSPRVVNRSSKFQRSAGLEDLTSTSNSSSRRKGGLGGCGDSKNHIRITTTGLLNNNPRLPPFPHPTNIPTPLAQFKHGPIIPGITNVKRPSSNTAQSKINSNHSSESSCVSVCFASSRGHIAGKPNGPMGGGGGGVGGVGVAGEGVGGVGAGQLGLSAAAAAAGGCTAPPGCPRVDSLFVVSWSGILVEYVLTPTATTVNLSLLTNVTSSSNNNNGSDKVLDLLSSAKAQWPLIRNKNSAETHLPLHRHNALLQYFERLCSLSTPNSSDQATPPTPQAPPPTGLGCTAEVTMGVGAMQVGASLCNGSRESLASSENYDNDAWLSQVEIITYAGPHRRLWMGPQFSFRTYQQAAPTNRGRGSSGDIPHDSQDIDTTNKINTSSPVQMPNHGKFKQNDSRYIQSGSYDPHPIENIQSNSWQDTSHSMKLHDIASGNSSSSLPSNGSGGGGAGGVGGCEDETLCEHIAEAMLESPINRGGHIYGEAGITTQTINVDHYSNTPSSSYDSLNSQRLVDNDA